MNLTMIEIYNIPEINDIIHSYKKEMEDYLEEESIKEDMENQLEKYLTNEDCNTNIIEDLITNNDEVIEEYLDKFEEVYNEEIHRISYYVKDYFERDDFDRQIEEIVERLDNNNIVKVYYRFYDMGLIIQNIKEHIYDIIGELIRNLDDVFLDNI